MTLEEFSIKAMKDNVPFKTRGRTWTGWDCWGMIVVAYREVYGTELPTYTEQYRSIKQKDLLASVINKGKKDKWHPVKEAQEGDVIIIFMEGREMHAGLAINDREMIHAQFGIGTGKERIAIHRLEGIYRRDDK
jgi:cell wall-associated NlpC family hydrolase